MPAKVVYNKEKIIQSTYNLIEKVGANNLTARKIAAHMHASTAPIYSSFTSTEELIDEVLDLAVKNLLKHTTTEFSDQLFLNIGMGIITFARDNKNIYSAIVLDHYYFKKKTEKEIRHLMELAKQDQRFEKINPSDLDELMEKMWTFIFGLATLEALGLNEKLDDGEIMKKLLNVGAIFIGEALYNVKIKEENPNL